MTLHVTFDQFSATVKRLLQRKDVYMKSSVRSCVVSCADPVKATLVASRTHLSVQEVRSRLEKDGLEVFEGVWAALEPNEALEPANDLFVAAVAYISDDPSPGVWIDAYHDEPTSVDVLRKIYDEFIETGELSEVSFEEFLRLSHAHVVIASPSDLATYAQGNRKPS